MATKHLSVAQLGQKILDLMQAYIIDFFDKYDVSNHLIKIGNYIKKEWKILADKNDIKIEIGGLNTIPSFQFKYGKDNEKIYTLFTDLMLKKKYLATNSIYLSYQHKKKDIIKYLKTLDKVFFKIKNCLINKDLSKIKTRKFNY